MRNIGFIAIAITGLGLSGCSQVSNIFKKKPHYHTADGAVVYTDAEGLPLDASLRSSPEQTYQFAEQNYDFGTYNSGSTYAEYNSPYAGYGVELYESSVQPSYAPVSYTDPRDVEFVMLNGESKINDWQNCETQHRGYLYASEYNFSLNPGFEVCMRNKGYVLTSEYGAGTKQTLNAQSARLRGPIQYGQSSYTQSSYSSTSYSQPSYSEPTYSQPTSTYTYPRY